MAILPPRRSARMVPYTLGLVGGMTVERAAEIAPDVLWFQLYRCSRNEHAIGFDLVRRAEAAGVHVLVLTLDVPVRTTRAREVAAGITSPFRPNLRMIGGTLTSPGYLARVVAAWPTAVRQSQTLHPCGSGLRMRCELCATGDGRRIHLGRDRTLSGALETPAGRKGILHPADAEKCVALGVDGIIVSNHGGRQVEGLPASIDVLPAIARAVGARTVVMLTAAFVPGSMWSARTALGADMAFAGKAFLWGFGALGAQGPGHVIDLLIDEMKSTSGADRSAQARGCALGLHPPSRRFGVLSRR